MKLAIMQPYLFPYLGYFQLIAAVDRFVVYDDVSFIKQGWINRNKILVKGKEFLFAVPIKHISSFVFIKDTIMDRELYSKWRGKFLKSLTLSYSHAPYYQKACTIVEEVLWSESEYIMQLARNSLKIILSYLEIRTSFVDSSTIYHNSHLTGQERIIDICKKEGATEYVNLKGGMKLYSKCDFQKKSIILSFITSLYSEYKQFENKFVPSLSIIDILMFNSLDRIHELLENYELL
jgi:hypothetical protein